MMQGYVELRDHDAAASAPRPEEMATRRRLTLVGVVGLVAGAGALAAMLSSQPHRLSAEIRVVATTRLQASSACPTLESGIDYVGNDIGAILGSGAADCCTKCTQRTGCGAFTWSNYDGGTCWLKSGKGSTIAKAGVISAALSVPVPPVTASCPTVETNVDYVGKDIANAPSSSPSGCCAKCSQRTGCGAFTWSNYNGGTCWLKSGKGAVANVAGVVSAMLSIGSTPPPTTAAPTTPPTTTSPTTPLTTVAPTSPPSALFPLPPATTAPTATVTCPDVQVNVEFVGNDHSNAAGANVYDCCSKCQQRGGCAVFTWTSYNGGWCWFKTQRNVTATKSGAVSGVLATTLSTPAPAPPPSTWTLGHIVGGVSKAQTNLPSDNGVIGNPLSYPSAGCVQPNYISKNNKIYMVGPRGETEPMAIKGVNWFGMETEATVPLGMHYNAQNGSTAYSIAAFLQRNNFNSVRLPIRMESLLNNIVPGTWAVNANANRAIKLDNYMNLIKSVVKALAYRQISVLIDIHTLTSTDVGLLWYNDQLSEARFLDGIDLLTRNLCSSEFYNVIGIDLKNEPAAATWGDDSATDFRAAATRIGNRMLAGCPNWLAFVEGITETRSYTTPASRKVWFADWWGAGLAKAKQFPVTLNVPNKVVYAPHYYTPAVWPADYYYNADWSELSDASLTEMVRATFDTMFGFLAQEPAGPAVVLGEFGGVFSLDKHPAKTMQRSVRTTVELLLRPGFSGGYVWSLNPESGYDWNPVRTRNFTQEGLLLSDWRFVNEPMLAAFKPLDAMPDLKPLRCFT